MPERGRVLLWHDRPPYIDGSPKDLDLPA